MALFGRLLEFIVGVLLWPLAGCLGYALLKIGWQLPWWQGSLLWFAGGFAAYLIVQALFWKPLFFYVMGHELTHALAALLHGGQVDDLRVSTKGGQVKVNVSNFLVSLAPYFFPLYTAGAALIYVIAAEPYRPWFVAVIGFTLAFHFALTLYSLKQHQSDLEEVGWLFAIPFIAAVNVIVTVLVLRLVAPQQLDLGNYFGETWASARGSIQWVRARL
jgi:hypothetical protein